MNHLFRLYGAEAHKLLEYGSENHNALEPITPGAPDLWAQVHHAISEEWAVTAEDIIFRRTSLGLRGFDTPEIRRWISSLIEGESPQTAGPRILAPRTSRFA
jgi:glycerol-3-phosphate dehydrogenase